MQVTYFNGQVKDYSDTTPWEIEQQGVLKIGKRGDGEWRLHVSPSAWQTLDIGPE